MHCHAAVQWNLPFFHTYLESSLNSRWIVLESSFPWWWSVSDGSWTKEDRAFFCAKPQVIKIIWGHLTAALCKPWSLHAKLRRWHFGLQSQRRMLSDFQGSCAACPEEKQTCLSWALTHVPWVKRAINKGINNPELVLGWVKWNRESTVRPIGHSAVHMVEFV